MPIGGKDAFLSKVTFRRESKWYSKTKQELKDMATIEERANLAAWQIYEETILSEHSVDRVAEIIAEKIHEQKAIDIDKVCDWLSNYFVFEHEAMTATGCDAFLKALRKAMEE